MSLNILDSTPEPLFYVTELFGPTIQGEGRQVGSLSHFVRFGGCDYNCTWCDSMDSVQAQQFTKAPKLSAKEILSRVVALPRAPWVVLTGGNPALFKLYWLVRMLQDHGFNVSVETQGTRWSNWLRDCDLVCVSPKPPSSGMKTNWPQLESFMEALWDTPRFLKVPIMPTDSDVEFLKEVADQHPSEELFASVVTLPNDTERQLLDRTVKVFERVKDMGRRYNHIKILPQFHVLLWGHQKGV